MADTNFTDATTSVNGTPIVSSWLDDVNTNTYTVLGAIAGVNAITGTGPSTVLVAYPRGIAFRFIPVNNNTGAVTINISGLGVRNITKQGANPLSAGDLVAGSWAYIAYDNVQFQLINPQGPLDATDTYITTAGSSTAYTLPVVGNFTRFSGNAVKMIFHTANTSTTPTLDVDGTGVAAIKVMSTTGVKIDPIVGAFGANIPATAIWDGTNWLVAPEYPSGRLLNTQTFTANGTYTPTPGTTSTIVDAVGGGGAGGGAPATAAGQASVGAGGSSGGRTVGRFINPGSQAITIGGGGAAAAGVGGGVGGVTSFGALLTANGGLGGPVSAAGALVAVNGVDGAAASGTGGNIFAVQGEGTDPCLGNNATSIFSGGGGASALGGKARGQSSGGTGVAGITPTAYGAGGGGAANNASQAARAGGNGAPGIIVVYEYS